MNKSFPICYETFGNAHDPCIILIAGIGGQLVDWSSILINGLANKGFFVVVFDNRDAGLSRHYDELGVPNFSEAIATIQQGQLFHPPYTLEDMAADVIALMDELHIEKAHIVGGSMGGIIAQYVALNYTNRVLSLTCIATTSGDSKLPPAKKEVLDFFTSSMNPENQSLESAVNKKLQLFKIYNHPDYFDEYDPVFSVEHGKQLAESIPGSHLEVIKKMGHGLPDYFAYKIVDLIVSYIKK